MPEPTILTTDILMKLNGVEVERTVVANLSAMIIDQHAHLPHMFTLRFQDPDLKLLDSGPFDLTKEVELSAKTSKGQSIVLMKGEITALEPEFGEGMIADLVIRGYDTSHRLYRETKTKTYLNVKDSDLAQQIAQAAKLKTEIEVTPTVYDHVFQHNQSDLAFLMQRAWRIGFECFVDQGKLYFRQPPTKGAKVTVTWGDDLLSFHPRMTLAEQVDEVIVKGWDVQKKAAIIGQADKGETFRDVAESKDGASWAKAFGKGKLVIVDQPVVSQTEANILAKARLNEINGAFIEAEGVAYRRPDIKAGQMIRLEALGKRLSGTYLVTSATHVYTAEGFKTTFSVRGIRTGLLTEQLTHATPLDRWPGVAPAIVTNTDDPKNWGRVKVKFPWMSDEVESDWARVVCPGAGPEAGFCAIPAVDDEVLVAFASGDFSQPFVLGGVWNGKNNFVPETAGAGNGEKPLVRSWRSRSGHWLAMYDDKNKKVEIVTKDGHRFVLDDKNKKIEIVSKGSHRFTLDDNGKKATLTSGGGLTINLEDNSRKITIKSGGEIELNATTNLKIQAGGNLDLQATGQVKIQGTMINLN